MASIFPSRHGHGWAVVALACTSGSGERPPGAAGAGAGGSAAAGGVAGSGNAGSALGGNSGAGAEGTGAGAADPGTARGAIEPAVDLVISPTALDFGDRFVSTVLDKGVSSPASRFRPRRGTSP